MTLVRNDFAASEDTSPNRKVERSLMDILFNTLIGFKIRLSAAERDRGWCKALCYHLGLSVSAK